MTINSSTKQKIAIFGASEYAFMEAYLLSQHHQVCLVFSDQNQRLAGIELIKKSQELKIASQKLAELEQIAIEKINPNNCEVVIFFDGNEGDFSTLNQICQNNQFSIIDCSSYDWQLDNLKNSIDRNRYYVLAQYPQQGELYSQLIKRKYLIIGANFSETDQANQLIESIYQPFTDCDCIIKNGDIRSVYLSKFILNTHLSFRITVMNEAARVSELLGANIETIRECISLDQRLGKEYLKAGTGFGGTSFMNDLNYLAKLLNQSSSSHSLLQDAIEANQDQQEILFRKLWHYFDMNLKQKKIAIWGLSYKPDTADISLSPAIRVLEILLSQGSKVSAFDPLVKSKDLREKFSNTQINAINLSKTALEACQDADALLIFNELDQFKNIDLVEVREQMKQSLIFDGRNLFDLETMQDKGFEYFSVGRKSLSNKQ